MLVTIRGIGRPLKLIASRREEQMQLMRGDQPLEPRIRGPLDRGHIPAPGPDDNNITTNNPGPERVTGRGTQGLKSNSLPL